MKTKIKRHSRSVISVILAVCMLVSCMMVGLIATDAAKLSADKAVGASVDTDSVGATTYYVKGAWDEWATPQAFSGTNTEVSITINTAGTYEFCFSNSNNDNYMADDVSFSSTTSSYYFPKKTGSQKNSKLVVTTTGTYKFKFEGDHNGSVRATITFPSNPVCSSVTLTPSTTTLNSLTEKFNLVANASDVAAALSGKQLTYTFYDESGHELGTKLSSTGSATLEDLTQDTRTKKYKVTVSYSGYESKTSDLEEVTNDAVTAPEYVLLGQIINDWSTGQSISSVDASYGANIYYIEVDVSDTTTNSTTNRFRVKNSTSEKSYASLNSEGTKDGDGYRYNMDIDDDPFTCSEIAKTEAWENNFIQINPTEKGKYRIYVDQSGDTPKVWVTGERDIFITSVTGFHSSITFDGTNSYVDKNAVTSFTSDANTKFKGYVSGKIWKSDPITSSTTGYVASGAGDYTGIPFMLSTVKGVEYDLEYSIRDDLCTGVTFMQDHIRVGNPEDGDYAQVFYIKNNVVNTDKYTKNIILHLDKEKKEIWATSTFDQTEVSLQSTTASTKTVRYYFAVTDPDYAGFVTNGQMQIHYWNNSLSHGSWEGNGSYYGHAPAVPVNSLGSTTSVTDKTDNKIYIDLSNPVAYTITGDNSDFKGSKYFKMQTGKSWGTSSYSITAYIYCADIPVWATSFAFANSDGASYGQYTNGAYSQRGIVLNPNRVYVAFGYGGNKWGDSGRAYYTTAVRLDKSLWSSNSGTNADEAASFIKTFKTNLVKYIGDTDGDDKDRNPAMNKALRDVYASRGIENELYFGNFWNYTSSTAPEFAGSVKPVKWKPWNNLAQRGEDATKFSGNNKYYASVWDLAGNVLDKSKKNNLDGYLLTDTYQKAVLPFFDYDTLSTSGNGFGTVYKDVEFPFYKTTYMGITSYSYDSMSDYNREYDTSTGKYTYTGYKALNNMQGYQPFSDQDESFANEFDIDFYMTSTGYLKDDSNTNHDITFNFSGDDDVWVYIDGVKVLDLGGAHMISAGSINLSEMKAYYKTPAMTTTDTTLDSCTEDFGNSATYMRVIDLQKLFDVYGVTFDKKDASTQHKLQMFYVERGQNESNCSISFNLPQNSGLRIQNEINVEDVNAGLKAATLLAADKDYFSYYIENRVATDTEVTNAKGIGVSDIPDKADGLVADSTFYSTTPDFPVNNTATVYRKTNQLLVTGGKTNGVVSNTPTYDSSTGYFGLSGLNYTLTDAYPSATIDNTLSGRVLNGASEEKGVRLNLLYGQSATFDGKITPNTWLVVKQENKLYNPENGTDTITRSEHSVDTNVAEADQRNASRFYATTYTITDDAATKQINNVVSINNKEEDVVATGRNLENEADGYYFSNYSDTTNAESVTATYKFVNTPHTGNITFTKLIDAGGDEVNLKASFEYTIQFKDIFGIETNAYQDYDVKYRVYNADGSYVDRTYFATDHSILLRHGQTAEILGIPAGTKYTLKEKDDKPGYVLDNIVKNSYRSGELKKTVTYTTPADFIKPSDIDYLSKNDSGKYLAEFTFTNKPVDIKVVLKYYDRKVVSGSETVISDTPSEYTYIVKWNQLPTVDSSNNPITWRVQNDEGDTTLINTKALISYVAGKANINNILCNYTFFDSNATARTEMLEKRYRIVDGVEQKYKDSDESENLSKHTNYIGVPVSTNNVGDEWVTYKAGDTKLEYSISGSSETLTEAGYNSLTTIEAWAFNDPKTYELKAYHADVNESGELDVSSVFAYDASKNDYVSGDTAPDTIVGKAYSAGADTYSGFYNIRMGGVYEPIIKDDMTEAQKDAELAKAALLNRPSVYLSNYFNEPANKGFTGTYPTTANNFSYEFKDGESQSYKFAYWASDIKGENMITKDYHYGYRITQDMDIYPVYVKSDTVIEPVSLILESGGVDINSAGTSITRRFNTYFNVSGAEPNDANLEGKNMSIVYVRLGKDSNATTPQYTVIAKNSIDMAKLKETYLARLAELNTWGQKANTIYIDVTDNNNAADARRGTAYKYSITFAESASSSQAVFNNKNRVLVSHTFNDALFAEDAAFENMLIYGAVQYGNDWKCAENYLFYNRGVLQ